MLKHRVKGKFTQGKTLKCKAKNSMVFEDIQPLTEGKHLVLLTYVGQTLNFNVRS